MMDGELLRHPMCFLFEREGKNYMQQDRSSEDLTYFRMDNWSDESVLVTLCFSYVSFCI